MGGINIKVERSFSSKHGIFSSMRSMGALSAWQRENEKNWHQNPQGPLANSNDFKINVDNFDTLRGNNRKWKSLIN